MIMQNNDKLTSDELTCSERVVYRERNFVKTRDLQIKEIFVSWSQIGQTVDVGFCLPWRRRRDINVLYNGTVNGIRVTEIPLQPDARLTNIANTRKRRNNRICKAFHNVLNYATCMEESSRHSRWEYVRQSAMFTGA